ncbi:MAG: HAD-IC family P-type ATPase, partial [Legionella sp.]
MSLYLGHSIFRTAWRELWNKELGMSSLYTISTLTIIGLSIASLLIPGLPMTLEAAPLVLGFWHLGEAIEHGIKDQITNELDLQEEFPKTVKLKGENAQQISVNTLIPNDIITVDSVIPTDGVLLTDAEIFTTSKTGNLISERFKAGMEVKSGMSLTAKTQSLEMRVTKTNQKSYLATFNNDIDRQRKEKPLIEDYANTLLKYFVPALLSVAVLSGITISILFSPVLAIQCVISVLVSACPCALSVITPLTATIARNKVKQLDSDIGFKDHRALQAASDIDTVVFDLNGTLTQGVQEIDDFIDPNYLKHAQLLQSQDTHHVAKSISAYLLAKLNSLETAETEQPLVISDFDDSEHSGIKAIINGEQFIMGNRDMLAAHHITQINAPYNNPEQGDIYFVRNTTVIGQIKLHEPLRADAKATIAQLKSQGKTVHLCTGAERTVAERNALLLGIPKENIGASMAGTDPIEGQKTKNNYINELIAQGRKVAMVGDG